MKKVFWIAGLAIGVAAIVVCLLNRKDQECAGCAKAQNSEEKEEFPTEDTALTCDAPVAQETVYEGMKESAIETMYYRHKAAAAAVGDSVEAIRENVKVSKDTSEAIDAVSAELDKMMSED